LKFDGLFSNSDHLGPKLDSNGDFVLLAKTMVDELKEETGLPDT
jgi:hypothetical protein